MGLNNFYKKIISVMSLIYFGGCLHAPHQQIRNPSEITSSSPTKKHIVVTIHGLRGTDKSFGEFHKFIKPHLEDLDPTFEVIPVNFIYNPSSMDFNPLRDVVPLLNDTIIKVGFNDKDPEVSDKISIVMYSMGGNVGLAWLNDALINFNNRDSKSALLIKNLDNFITLGAPFWGSKEAAIGEVAAAYTKFDMNTILTNKYISPITQFTDSQMNLLSMGAQDSFFMRKDMLKWKLLLDNNKIATNTPFRVQNSIGLFPCISGTLELPRLDEVLKMKDAITNLDGYRNGINNFVSNTKSKIMDINLKDLAKEIPSVKDVISYSKEAALYSRDKLSQMDISQISKTLQSYGHSLESLVNAKIKTQTDCRPESWNGIDRKLNEMIVSFFFGGERRESDMVVISPSATLNFIYAEDLDSNKNNSVFKPKKYIKNTDFKDMDFVNNKLDKPQIQNYYTQILHATVAPTQTDDFVVVEDMCEKFEEGCTPYYKLLVRDLAHCQGPKSSCVKEKFDSFAKLAFTEKNYDESLNSDYERANQLRGFNLELNLRVPNDYEIPSTIDSWDVLKHIQFNFADANFGKEPFPLTVAKNYINLMEHILTYPSGYNEFTHFTTDGLIKLNEKDEILKFDLQIARSLEIYSRIVRIHKENSSNEKMIRIILTGRAMPRFGVSSDEFWNAIKNKNGIILPFKISLPGLNERKIDARVKPGISTFIDLTMKREQ